MSYIKEDRLRLRKPTQRLDTRVFPRTAIITDPESIQRALAHRQILDVETGQPKERIYREEILIPPPEETAAVSLGQVDLPPHLYPPLSSVYFDSVGEVSVPTGNAETTIVTYTMPSGKEGWWRYFGHDVDALASWGQVSWYLKINGNTFAPYGAITRQLGTITEMTETIKKLDEGDIIKISAAQNSGIAIVCRGRIKGWEYPKS